MAGRIGIDSERCKGCGLCVKACTRQRIGVSRVSNRNGFFPAQPVPGGCTGCALCALVCPEAAIKVYREAAVELKPSRRTRKTAGVVKEKP